MGIAERSLNLGFLRARTREKHTAEPGASSANHLRFPDLATSAAASRPGLKNFKPCRQIVTLKNEAKLLLQNASKQVQRQP